MAYQALYRKYRPQTFSDVIGQEHITKTLKNEVSSNKTVHAYLFTGSRGTGKTSCAKILAKAVNCLSPKDGDPCLECEMCRMAAEGENTDIVEIDAASNNSVDSIRELREQVTFAPASSKYRVYIIDEVHMLTVSAFNALLKTLEEPPEHVIFILATTEVHKLPSTILSRCQRFDFRRIDSEKICERIQYIASKEGLTVTDDAASLIAAAADGGMRDALSILDLCASGNKNIDENTVASVCAMAGNDYLVKMADFIKSRDCENALMLLDELHNSSVDMLRLLGELITHYRNLMIIKTVKSGKRPIVCSASQLKALEKQAENYDIKDIMRTLNILQASTSAMQTGNRRCEMEMAVIRLCTPELSDDTASLERRIAALEQRAVSSPARPAEVDRPIEDIKETADTAEEEIPLPDAPPPADNTAPEPKTDETDGYLRVARWEDILSILRRSCPLIAGVLEGSSAYTHGAYLLIDAPNGQFRSLINGGNTFYRDSIRKAALEILGKTYKLGPYTKSAAKAETDPLAAFAENYKRLQNNQQ